MKRLLQRNRLKSWLTIPSLLLVIGCTQESFNDCGTLFKYSPEFQAKAAKELDDLQGQGTAPEVVKLVEDYSVTRQTIRACK